MEKMIKEYDPDIQDQSSLYPSMSILDEKVEVKLNRKERRKAKIKPIKIFGMGK